MQWMDRTMDQQNFHWSCFFEWVITNSKEIFPIKWTMIANLSFSRRWFSIH
jgi:hypothetical protein